MTKAEQLEAARAKVCPRCHAEAGKPCRAHSGGYSYYGKPMKGVHDKRLALVKEQG